MLPESPSFGFQPAFKAALCSECRLLPGLTGYCCVFCAIGKSSPKLLLCDPGRVGSLSFDGELSPLQAFVEAEARELPSAAFALFMQELYTAIDRLVVTSPRWGSPAYTSMYLCLALHICNCRQHCKHSSCRACCICICGCIWSRAMSHVGPARGVSAAARRQMKDHAQSEGWRQSLPSTSSLTQR